MNDQSPAGNARAHPTLLECLGSTPYDEMIEYDLINNRCRNLYHTDGKFFVPLMDGTMEAVCGFAVNHMVHPEDRAILREFLNPMTMEDRLRRSPTPGILKTEVRYKLLDGAWNWTRRLLVGGEGFGLPAGIVRGYLYDIQSEKKLEEERGGRTFEALYQDERTGLPNDRLMFSIARQKAERLQGDWCVIAIDIEHFRLFADWHGQEAANLLLAQIGEMLRRTAQDTNGLAGYRGQDDFWLMIPYDLRLIHSLYEEMRKLIVAQGNTVGFLPIFGISLVSPQEDIINTFNHAALTAEHGKGDLHNRIRMYNASASLQTAEEYRMLTDFQRALENRELFFCLQPQCRVPSGRVVGAESLARWRLADGSMVPPAKFVPILEKYGMVTNLDQFIWEEVCAWLRSWIDRGHTPVPVSLNVSQIDILTIDVPAHFAMLLQKYALPPNTLKIEITESAYVNDTAVARDAVRKLRGLGLMVLMDDFGSGYSSLNMLRSINVDVLKLDAQFLHISKQEERKGISILESVVNMAKTINLPIIVEGVETQEQISFLEDLGCRYIQGYYFYRPMPVAEFEHLIEDEKHLDLRGFEFKSNEQIHPREFLDENVFSDAMLNNILGPVAFYRWDGKKVDIVRYNQQFFLMVGIPVHQMNERKFNIQDYFYRGDAEKMNKMLAAASRDHLNGAKGVVRVYRPNGSLRWISMQLYYLNETEEGQIFYGSCEDVTELQFINVDLPGGYHRVTADERLEFRFISQNFQEMTGYTEAEIQTEFDNRFSAMVHPDDLPLVREKLADLLVAHTPSSEPFRIRCKKQEGGYIYVTSQLIVTDLYGEVCLMGIANDVTAMMRARNDMRLLAQSSSDCVVFARKSEGKWDCRVIIYGMEKRLGLTQAQFSDAFRQGTLFAWVEDDRRSALRRIAHEKLAKGEDFSIDFDAKLPSGQALPLRFTANRIQNTSADEYVCVLHAR